MSVSVLSKYLCQSEPTTDGFHAITYGPTDRAIPGNAAAVDVNRQFVGLAGFGANFLRFSSPSLFSFFISVGSTSKKLLDLRLLQPCFNDGL